MDFYNTSAIPKSDFESLFARNPSKRDMLLDIALSTDNYVYLRLDKCPDTVVERIKQWDIGDGSNQFISVADYIPCALERLEHWVDSHVDGSETVVIDSGYLQNPINELLFRRATDGEVREFINAITNILLPLSPVCIYLRRDNAEQAIDFAKMAKGKGWADRVDKLLQQHGCENLFQRRFKIELSLLENVEHISCHVYGDNWDDAKKGIQDYFAV